MMTPEEFTRLAAAGYNRIPVTLELHADLDTPLSVYLKLANAPYSYLLESVVGGERFGRYSFIGLPATTRLRVNGLRVQVEHGDRVLETHEGDPLGFIESFQQRFRTPQLDQLPRFNGGLVGYFGYETIRLIEKRLAARPPKPDVIGTPDILLMLSEELAIVDNLSGKLYLVVYADPAVPNAFAKAEARLKQLRGKLREPAPLPLSLPSRPAVARSEFGEEAFKTAVASAQRYIVDGDIMQVVLSQRMSLPYEDNPLSLYRALRSLNPSPYLFYYHFDDFHVVGSSPEILVRQEDRQVTVRPIAGTRPRGKSREEDQALAEELLADPKEIAEHVMLMDLGRNDIGRVAETGSVSVTDKMVIERYSHVMHIVSSVEGQLRDGMSNLDVLRATFPAGTLSGAPKVRAMEIIDEFEPGKRGVYGGAVGYLGFNGDMDLAIAIRTAVIKDGQLFVQAGAGVVADSVPQSEWQETCNKARAVIRAAELVQAGLDA
ncbi:anthranilate synthase component I [Laribacter hongkongensis]|nr:anthranilate synthase component I [Laribacter hongkongensis]MCG8994664.1 anthranilate synthase component I [Laribacter hongkongensis]MCG9009447.1 anthranilate synthase component I [Laribacter hongkongensis]MCG9021894.1 anthranilate synthase component I [Laribacter hongkongensis]MCG9041210.1 anthranilate synthase component I [Laribacter hongkongensis]MCG9045733.1 anthranilate synthase component I [Laribacter hongkongensis]